MSTLISFLVGVPLFMWVLDREFKRLERVRRAQEFAKYTQAFEQLGRELMTLGVSVRKVNQAMKRFGEALDGK